VTIDAEHTPLAARVSGWLGRGSRNRADAPQERPRRRLTWPLRGLLAASLAVPLLLLAIAASQNFRLVQGQAEERVMIEAGELHEHALDALKTYAIVLAWIDARTRGRDWDRIEHDEELHRFLSDLDTLPQIDEVSAVALPRSPRSTSPIAIASPPNKSRTSASLSEASRSGR
jgi:hypothetical protein